MLVIFSNLPSNESLLPVADSLRVAGLGRNLTAGLSVTSTVGTLSLVDLNTLLLHLAVLVVGGGALLVIHRGALLEHLLLHHHHGELPALLALHLLGLQSEEWKYNGNQLVLRNLSQLSELNKLFQAGGESLRLLIISRCAYCDC